MLSAIFVFIGYSLFFGVLLQNSYAARVIEIQEKQKLIDNGLYAIVRHPMYLAAIVGLAGNIEYKKRVNYKIIPLIW